MLSGSSATETAECRAFCRSRRKALASSLTRSTRASAADVPADGVPRAVPGFKELPSKLIPQIRGLAGLTSRLLPSTPDYSFPAVPDGGRGPSR
jgi:hypothetical protein